MANGSGSNNNNTENQSEKKLFVTDKKRAQLEQLRDNLEDIELYLKEIDSTISTLEGDCDEATKEQCLTYISSIRQRIATIGIENTTKHRRGYL
ncbi:hypothetical protein RsTz2092_05900 [Deferribacterales bacterium RsTz2092]|nr:hypothetical protein AGMMS49941_03490 [Deferribacterales bacterium]